MEEGLDELEVEIEEREGARDREREKGSYFIDHSHIAEGRRTEQGRTRGTVIGPRVRETYWMVRLKEREE